MENGYIPTHFRLTFSSVMIIYLFAPQRNYVLIKWNLKNYLTCILYIYHMTFLFHSSHLSSLFISNIISVKPICPSWLLFIDVSYILLMRILQNNFPDILNKLIFLMYFVHSLLFPLYRETSHHSSNHQAQMQSLHRSLTHCTTPRKQNTFIF